MIDITKLIPESNQIIYLLLSDKIKECRFMWFVGCDKIDVIPIDNINILTIHKRNWNNLFLTIEEAIQSIQTSKERIVPTHFAELWRTSSGCLILEKPKQINILKMCLESTVDITGGQCQTIAIFKIKIK